MATDNQQETLDKLRTDLAFQLKTAEDLDWDYFLETALTKKRGIPIQNILFSVGWIALIWALLRLNIFLQNLNGRSSNREQTIRTAP